MGKLPEFYMSPQERIHHFEVQCELLEDYNCSRTCLMCLRILSMVNMIHRMHDMYTFWWCIFQSAMSVHESVSFNPLSRYLKTFYFHKSSTTRALFETFNRTADFTFSDLSPCACFLTSKSQSTSTLEGWLNYM